MNNEVMHLRRQRCRRQVGRIRTFGYAEADRRRHRGAKAGAAIPIHVRDPKTERQRDTALSRGSERVRSSDTDGSSTSPAGMGGEFEVLAAEPSKAPSNDMVGRASVWPCEELLPEICNARLGTSFRRRQHD